MPFLDPALALSSRQEASGYAGLRDPRSPETIECCRRDGLKRLERAGDGEITPDHDKT